jgi:hypothetical protein
MGMEVDGLLSSSDSSRIAFASWPEGLPYGALSRSPKLLVGFETRSLSGILPVLVWDGDSTLAYGALSLSMKLPGLSGKLPADWATGGGGGKDVCLGRLTCPSAARAAPQYCLTCMLSYLGRSRRDNSLGKRSFLSSALLIGMSRTAMASLSNSPWGCAWIINVIHL